MISFNQGEWSAGRTFILNCKPENQSRSSFVTLTLFGGLILSGRDSGKAHSRRHFKLYTRYVANALMYSDIVACLCECFKSLTGSRYPYVQYGKPARATYKFAESILAERIEELYGIRGKIPNV